MGMENKGFENPTSKEEALPIKYTGEYYKGVPESDEAEDDPVYRQILEEESLNWLKQNDPEYFAENFQNELAPSGYLVDKNGNETNYLPSQNISARFDEVEALALQKYRELLTGSDVVH